MHYSVTTENIISENFDLTLYKQIVQQRIVLVHTIAQSELDVEGLHNVLNND